MPDRAPSSFARGLGYAIGAYGIWGVLPVYFLLLVPSGPVEIVAIRILLSLVFCVVLLSVTRGWADLVRLARSRRVLLGLGVAGSVIVLNWLTYVFATMTGHVVEAALGYFINPIVTVLLGVLVLRERLRPLQWTAVGVSALAVIVLAVGYGSVPWISLVLAVSFGVYGLIKKQVGGRVDAIGGLTLETAWLTPAAVVALVVLVAGGDLVAGAAGVGHTVAMLTAGVVTAVPLLLFAAGARRLPLTHMGLTQYLAPVLQFVIGVAVLHEEMPVERWLGFALVWVALAVLTADMFLAGRAARRGRAVAVAERSRGTLP